MKALLIDDIKFHTNYILTSILICIILYPIFYLDREINSLIIGLILTIFIIFSLTVGKLCSEEECGFVYEDISTSNENNNTFVFVKFLEGFSVVLISILIIALENYLIKTLSYTKLYFNTEEFFYCLSLFIIFIGLFFILYYKYNYKIAIQSTCFILLISMFIIKFILTPKSLIINLLNYKYNYFITFVFSLIIYITLYKVCVYLYKIKNNKKELKEVY